MFLSPDINTLSIFVLLIGALYVINTLLNKLKSLRTYLLFARIGVPVHELSHGFFALLLLHKLKDVVLYQAPTNTSRSLGYVSHQARIQFLSPLTQLLIGIAPFFGGMLAIVLLTDFFEPGLIINSISRDVSATSITDIVMLCAWLVISHAVASHLLPSRSDVVGCAWGVIAIGVILAMITLYTPYLPTLLNSIAEFASWLTPYLMLTIYVQLACLLAVFALKLPAYLTK